MRKNAALASILLVLAALGATAGSGRVQAPAPPAGPEPSFWAGLKYRCIGPSRGGRVTADPGKVEGADDASVGVLR